MVNVPMAMGVKSNPVSGDMIPPASAPEATKATNPTPKPCLSNEARKPT